MSWYVLDENDNPVRETDHKVINREFKSERRIIKIDNVSEFVRVSTVFLMLDHNYIPGGPPVLFETMIFGGDHDGYQDRYTTKAEALIGHEKAVKLAKGEA